MRSAAASCACMPVKCWAAIRHSPISALIIGLARRSPPKSSPSVTTTIPHYKPLMGADVAAISVRGRADGNRLRFEGSAAPRPGALFWADLTRLDDEALPPVGKVGQNGIVNGLYSIHIRTLDGIDGGLSGVMLLIDGRILGCDAFFYYLGSYSSQNGRWKGEIINQEHTPAKGENPVFGGHEVGIGFSGTCHERGAELEAIALAGKRSLRLTATLKLMRPA